MELSLITELGTELVARGWRLATAESCTGGLVACSLTDVPGSSAWFEGGVVAYANHIKANMLNVPTVVLESHGAVSGPCVEGMATGICSLFDAPVGLAISGIAGPGGGTQEKPVGTVWMAWCVDGRVASRCVLFAGDRLAIKRQSMERALTELLQAIKNGASG